ncbi:hypothetical protein LEP1GSC098_2875 [Leptospira interrogans serovar Grippotyphosa str. UI 08434]|nr:hypothetical protein LEP1GSC098_2875 [Leptospira interrogans serovar Grippotyphosa str. UI 08434]
MIFCRIYLNELMFWFFTISLTQKKFSHITEFYPKKELLPREL